MFVTHLLNIFLLTRNLPVEKNDLGCPGGVGTYLATRKVKYLPELFGPHSISTREASGNRYTSL